MINGPAKAFLKEPQRLKFLLAPVLTKSAAEQSRFYELFDLWWADMQVPLPLSPGKRWWQYVPPAVWTLLGALLALFMGYLIYEMKIKGAKATGILSISQEKGVAVGDTFLFTSHFQYVDSLNYRLEWQQIDGATADGAIERRDTSRHWMFVWDTLSGSYDKTVRLFAYHRKKQDTLKADIFVRLYCASPPSIKDIVIQKNKRDSLLIDFKAEVIDRKGYDYEWDFGDGSTGSGIAVSHRFDNNIRYTIRLTVSDTTASGWCESVFTKVVDIGREKAYLPAFPLYEDAYSATAVFGWGATIAMFLLALAILFLWTKWMMREAPKPPPPPQAAKFESVDRAPYFIPWRNLDGHIKPSREQYRLADAFRLRQEGLIQLVDVPATVRATINKGGFPVFRFRYNTRPTDYLMLVDEQTHLSHQTRLFQYLTSQLRSQDVHLDIFYYDTDFHRFWNSAYPSGISLEVLQRLYPEHRLVVMGNAHALLDPYAGDRPRLRADYLAGLRAWRHRLLLTPLPPQSWTFREGVLYQFFALFPADIRGLGDAAVYVEAGLETEDLPLVYSQWESIQQKRRYDADINYRRWRDLKDYEEYLAGDPVLFLWLRALAVYPLPTWEITLAIGKALAPKGVVVNYDNLLKLSRIPWLQTGRLDPRLREALLENLDPEAEKLARHAVKEELEAVVNNTRNGHANLEAQTNLAIQQFAINPDDRAGQEAIQYLLDQGIITKKQEAELNQVVGRHTGTTGSVAIKGGGTQKKHIGGDDLQTFLAKSLPGAPDRPLPPPRPFFTPEFWWSAGLTTVFLALLGIMRSLSGTDTLCHIAFGQCAGHPDSLRNIFFVKETLKADSAVIYNNLGVKQWDQTKDTSAVELFRKAIATRSTPYTLAYENRTKVYYNTAHKQYMAFLKDSAGIDVLPGVQALFRQAAKPYIDVRTLINLEAIHGIGLTHFYLEQRDSAEAYYRQLIQLSDSSYFTNLRYAPNLETLLGIKASRILDVRVLESTNGALPVVVDYYYDPAEHADLRLDLAPLNDKGDVPRGFTIAAAAVRPGQGSDTLVLRKPLRLDQDMRTDSLRLRLLTPRTRTVVAELTIAHTQVWEVIVPDKLRPPADRNIDLKKTNINTVTSSYLDIILLDDNADTPIKTADIRVEYTLDNEKTPRAAIAKKDGGFRLVTANKNPSGGTLSVTAYGYRPYTGRFTSRDWLTGSMTVSLTPSRLDQKPADEPRILDLTVNVYSGNQPLNNVDLVLFMQGEGGRLEQIAQKNTGRESNKAEFSVPAGNYTITADKAGFEPGSAGFALERPQYAVNLNMTPSAVQNPALPPSSYFTLYFDHQSPEKSALRDYETEYRAYLKRKNEYISYIEKLNNSNAAQAITRFFDEDLRIGYEYFSQTMSTISAELKKGGKVDVYVEGFNAISEGNTTLRRRIIENRINTIRNTFNNYNKGELAPYIKNGDLTIIQRNSPQAPSDDQNASGLYDLPAIRRRKVEITVEIIDRQQFKSKD